jgi:hypothetical protein
METGTVGVKDGIADGYDDLIIALDAARAAIDAHLVLGNLQIASQLSEVQHPTRSPTV